MAIHTTLYDLIAAFSAEVRPDEEDVLTATIVHLVNTHRVTCTGNLKDIRWSVTGESVRHGPGRGRTSFSLKVSRGSQPWQITTESSTLWVLCHINSLVTLRGPVNIPQERERIEAKAQYIAGMNKVYNQLEIIRLNPSYLS